MIGYEMKESKTNDRMERRYILHSPWLNEARRITFVNVEISERIEAWTNLSIEIKANT